MRQLANTPQPPTRGLAHLALAAALVAMICAPDLALAQASPFMTGASSLQTNILAWLTPVAIILVMALGGMAMANRISWGGRSGRFWESPSASVRRR